MIVNSVFTASIYRPKSLKNSLRVNTDSTHCGPVSLKRTYYNYLPINITIVDRNGLRYVIPPNISENETQEDFIIRQEFIIKYTSLEQVRMFVDTVKVFNNDEIEIIKSSFRDSTGNIYHGFVIIVDTKYPLSAFRENNTCLYCVKRDVVVSTKDINNASAHPADVDSVVGDEMLLVKQNNITDDDFVLRLEIVDNNDLIGDRYTYSLGEVRKIKAKKDSSKISGIYYHKVVKDIFAINKCTIVTEVYDIKEAEEKFGLFTSRSEAQEGGDLKEARKKEILDLQHKLELMKKAHEKEKHEQDVKDFEQERRNKLLQQEIEDEKMKNDLKKEIINTLKFLPQLIIAIGAIYIGINKLLPNK